MYRHEIVIHFYSTKKKLRAHTENYYRSCYQFYLELYPYDRYSNFPNFDQTFEIKVSYLNIKICITRRLLYKIILVHTSINQ